TTNPAVATGDGIALAYRAGARVADLEFVQFHPTVLDVPGAPRFLLSEALRGEGAWLVNAAGERFLARDDPQAELAPRDRVARAIARERERTGRPVYLSLTHLPAAFVHDRFPLLSATCRRAGLDLARDPIPVSPAAHYLMGGVATDLWGRTSIPGLFAAGESACTGVHGANRLASNSLLEGLVFGARAGRAMRAWVARDEWPEASARETLTPDGPPGEAPDASGATVPDADTIRDLMWHDVGLFRDRDGLDRALGLLEPAWRAVEARLAREPAGRRACWTTLSLLTVGRLIARAARRREESRGAHFRSDFPARDDLHWCRRAFETIRDTD
ncbi:MAG TPA: FAD-binding protein, partial [Vicinamibacterales bacterium]|nr:FAD-binding protein [Vicinamibacterales bacterium]